MLVHTAIGQHLAQAGVRKVFSVVGSGNFHVVQALVDGGAEFVAGRHEGGAVMMADGYARMSGEVAVLSVHQGCGFTNALTGITEAAKSRSSLLVLAAEATAPTSNFFIDQEAMARSTGAEVLRVRSPHTALEDIARAYTLCKSLQRTVVVNLPIDVQDQELPADVVVRRYPDLAVPSPAADAVADMAATLREAERPVLIVGRGGRTPGARQAVIDLAEACGALVATSAVSRGLFNGYPWSLDVSGGFSTPLTARLINEADVVVGFGCALNMWTMRHGKLIGAEARVVQVDYDPGALGRIRDVDLGVWGGVVETAKAVAEELVGSGKPTAGGVRTDALREEIATSGAWSQVPYEDRSGGGRIDPRTFSLRVNELLPAERVVSVDSGNFLGYGSMFIDVPDEFGFCFTQAFQSVGLGLATGIGAALAQPERLPVVAIGDGGFYMGLSELETAVRLGLPLLVMVYNDAQYGAEIHHFGGDVPGADNVRFPDGDIAAAARGLGCEALTVRSSDDIAAVKTWLSDPSGPLVLDAKVVNDRASWWLHEAFGH